MFITRLSAKGTDEAMKRDDFRLLMISVLSLWEGQHTTEPEEVSGGVE